MFCKHCGNQLDASAKFCNKCGNAVEAESIAQSPVMGNPSSEPLGAPVQTAPSAVTGSPIAVPTSEVAPAATPSAYHSASRLVRFVHYLIDTFVVGAVATIFLFAIVIALTSSGLDKDSAIFSVAQLVSFPITIVYYLWLEGKWKRTVGKWVTGYKVVMRDGSEPDFTHILGRTFARLIPFEPLSTLVSKVGWHDSLSKTLVVPKDYTPEQVQQITPEVHSSGRTIAIIVAVVIIGIIVIGLLSSVVLLALGSARTKSRDAKRVSDIRQIASGLELYYVDNGRYPANLSALSPDYLGEVPKAPTPQDGECSELDNSYTYSYLSTNNYVVSFCLGYETGGISAGKHTLTPQGVDSKK